MPPAPRNEAGSPSPPQAAEDGLNGPGVAVIEVSGVEGSAPPEPTLRSLGLPQPGFHAVILDFSSVSFVDTVSIKILKNVRSWRSGWADNLSGVVSRALGGWPNGRCLSLFLGKMCFLLFADVQGFP